MKSKGERKKILNYCKREIGIRKKEYKKRLSSYHSYYFKVLLKNKKKCA